jgi:hypothetical protein
VTWDHWSDAEPHLVPFGGLLDAEGRPKPLLSRLRALRTEHLVPERRVPVREGPAQGLKNDPNGK